MSDHAYGKIRSLVESLGGSMYYEREGFRYGAWIITLGEKTKVFEASGDHLFPELDRLYSPVHPLAFGILPNERPDAKSCLLLTLALTSSRRGHETLQIIGRKMEVCLTMLHYPHEYTTKKLIKTKTIPD